MSRIQIRKGLFETNSSSTHSIVIGNNGEDIYSDLPEQVYFEGGEFGWEHEVYNDVESKASYLYTSIVWCDMLEYIDKIKEILAKWNVEAIFEKLDKNGNFTSWSYVDHGGENVELVKQLCENEELLMNYLFSKGSFVETGNDNDDTEFTHNHPKNVMLNYYKGN